MSSLQPRRRLARPTGNGASFAMGLGRCKLERPGESMLGRRTRTEEVRPLRYSINVTLDGCYDHRVGIADEDLHRHAMENIAQADALLFGRVTYQMMEVAWRGPARTGERPDWMEPWM